MKCSAVVPSNSTPAASSWVTVAGLCVMRVDATVTNSAWVPSLAPVVPHTASPGANPRTSAPTASTTPEQPMPSTLCRGPAIPSAETSQRTASPLGVAQSALGNMFARGQGVGQGNMARDGEGREPSDMVALGRLIDCPRSDEPEVDTAIVAEREALMERLDAEDIEAARDVSAHVDQVFEEALQRQRGRLS